MNVVRYRRPLLETVFVLAEGLAWFIVIAVIATLVERSFLEGVASRIEIALGAREFTNPTAAEAVAAQLREAAGHDAGPPLPVVLAAAGGGFLLMRLSQRLDLGATLSAVLVLALTILGVNVLLHLTMGDLRFWDPAGMVALAGESEGGLAAGVDLQAFVDAPDIGGPHSAALGITFVALALTWFRFMAAGRSAVRMERMTRSFTVSFVVVLFALFVARTMDVDAAGRLAVPQFVLGMLGMAIGNHERAVPAVEADAQRTTPWAISVGGTLGLLLASAGLIAMLSYLEFGVVLSAIGEVLVRIIELALLVILTPVYWVLGNVLSFLLGGDTFGENMPQLRGPLTPEQMGVEEEEGVFAIPAWVWNSVKFFAMVLAAYALYRLTRSLMGRRQRPVEAVTEHRSTSTGGAGLGRLLADIVSFRRRPDPERWAERHEAYRLFSRSVADAGDRGLALLPSETPREFARAAHTHLDAAPIEEISRMFDRARYGRHFPPSEELREASSELSQWEQAVPATEELRQRVRGMRPMDRSDEIQFKIALAKRKYLTDDVIMRAD